MAIPLIARRVGMIAVAGLLWLRPVVCAQAQSEQEKLVAGAEVTFNHFLDDPQMEWFQENIGRAKAVLIAPEIVKAGFILGGSGGRAVLFARDPKTGVWHGPAFYTLATGSIGFQAGLEVSEAVTLVMTEKGLDSLLRNSFKMGGDASIAAGPIGAGTRTDIQADLVSYSRGKGIYGGLNLDGTVVRTSDNWNQAYYRAAVSPSEVLIRPDKANMRAARLRSEIAKAGKR